MPVSPYSPIFVPPIGGRHRSGALLAARSEFEAALEIQPENVKARNRLAGLAFLAKRR